MKEPMKAILDEHKIELFYLEDETFLSHPKKWLSEFTEWYGKDVRKPFIIQTRPESVTEEKIQMLFKMNAPFFQVSLGVESGSERILFEVCDRKTRIEKIVNAFDLLHRYKIRSSAFFMIGFPYETREDIFKTIELCRRVRPTISVVSIFQPLPGQKLLDTCIEEEYVGKDAKPVKFTDTSILKMPQISALEIANLRRTFLLYAFLPKEYYPDIEACEKDYGNNLELFQSLVKLRWELSAVGQ